jgi:hypothetical protein
MSDLPQKPRSVCVTKVKKTLNEIHNKNGTVLDESILYKIDEHAFVRTVVNSLQKIEREQFQREIILTVFDQNSIESTQQDENTNERKEAFKNTTNIIKK